MKDLTIIYYTDNSLEPGLFNLCQKYLKFAAHAVGEYPIISVSQKPIDFGKNICVGEIGKSLISLWTQQIAGMKKAKTKYLAFAEHDVIYYPWHFTFRPTDDDVFYYNANFWYMHTGNKDPELSGVYSWGAKRRPFNEFQIPQSQLISERKMAIKAYEERLELLRTVKESKWLPAEPGIMKTRALLNLRAEGLLDLAKWAEKWRADFFSTEVPNLDIQHGNNYSRKTKVRSGKKRKKVLPYWGTVEDVLNDKRPTR